MTWSGQAPIGVRIVLHTGEAFERQHDYFGSPLCVAKRLIDQTPAGSVWVTGVTKILLTSVLHDKVEVLQLGTKRLRGIDREIDVFHLVEQRREIIDVRMESAI